MSKILYLSCHEVLEFDEVKLLHEMGHEVFSPGAYVEPSNPGNNLLRPGITGLVYNPDVVEQFHRIGGVHPGEDAKDYLTKEFVNNFDVILVMHMPRWVSKNWEAMKHKTVIWRTIGQSISSTEQTMAPYRNAGMKIVRYSPFEHNIPGFIGEDICIRFYKDPLEYKGWTGEKERVITFAQHMQRRDRACNYSFFEEVTRPFPRCLFGAGSEDCGFGAGKVPFEQLKQEMKTNRCYFYTGTHPASYTLNFIEAFMTGIPIVAIGYERGNANYFPGHNLYEIPQLIQNHYSGFVSNNPRELQCYIDELLRNKDLAKLIGTQGRNAAIQLFGKERAIQGWTKILGSI